MTHLSTASLVQTRVDFALSICAMWFCDQINVPPRKKFRTHQRRPVTLKFEGGAESGLSP